MRPSVTSAAKDPLSVRIVTKPPCGPATRNRLLFGNDLKRQSPENGRAIHPFGLPSCPKPQPTRENYESQDSCGLIPFDKIFSAGVVSGSQS